METDYYNLLGIGRDAAAADIQKAYRQLARKYHPDVNPDDKAAKEKFQQIQQAYDVLNDSEKRELYDRYGSSFESMGAGGPSGGGGQWRQGGGAEFDFSQIFGGSGQYGEGGVGDFFRQFGGAGGGGGRRRRRPSRGADLQHEIEVPFQTAILGGEARISIQRPNGKVESITVKIPAGIESGKSIRLRGQGEAPEGGVTPGDLLIKIQVAAHPNFRRQGNNLEVTVPVTIGEAAVGAKIDLPTPKGVISLKVPPGTSSGKRLRVKGHGVQSAKSGPGDLFAEIQIVLPESLDKENLELLEQIDKKYVQPPRRELRW